MYFLNLINQTNMSNSNAAWKVSSYGVFLVRIFPYLDTFREVKSSGGSDKI